MSPDFKFDMFPKETCEVGLENLYLFGRFLQAQREFKKISRKKMAGFFNLNSSSIFNWETAETFPEEGRLNDIMLHYGFKDDQFAYLQELFLKSKEARKLEKETHLRIRKDIRKLE